MITQYMLLVLHSNIISEKRKQDVQIMLKNLKSLTELVSGFFHVLSKNYSLTKE